jgi:hypothetical protein
MFNRLMLLSILLIGAPVFAQSLKLPEIRQTNYSVMDVTWNVKERHLPNPDRKIPKSYKSGDGKPAPPEAIKLFQAIDKRDHDGYTTNSKTRFIVKNGNICVISLSENNKLEQMYFSNGYFIAWCVNPPEVSEVRSRFEFQDAFLKFQTGLKTVLCDYPFEADLREKIIERVETVNGVSRILINQDENLKEQDAIAIGKKKLFNKFLKFHRDKSEVVVRNGYVDSIKLGCN